MEAKRNNSKKRRAILEALASVTEHPTAETIFNMLKDEFPELSLGTVYRNLGILADEGQVVRVAHVSGQERHDARTESHAHFICRNCNKVMDLDLPDTVSKMYSGIEQSLGCCAEHHSLSFTGLCGECKQNQ